VVDEDREAADVAAVRVVVAAEERDARQVKKATELIFVEILCVRVLWTLESRNMFLLDLCRFGGI